MGAAIELAAVGSTTARKLLDDNAGRDGTSLIPDGRDCLRELIRQCHVCCGNQTDENGDECSECNGTGEVEL